MYLEHAMESKMESLLENYERKDEVDAKVALLKTEVRKLMKDEYVTNEFLGKQLKDYVPLATAEEAVGKYAKGKVDEEMAKDETKAKIVQIAESAVTGIRFCQTVKKLLNRRWPNLSPARRSESWH